MFKRLMMLSVFGLAACQMPEPPALSPTPSPTPTAPDTCQIGDVSGLIGRDATILETMLIMGEVRVIRPGMAVTMDYRPERLNIEVGENGRIERVYCG